jgi:hypothetical protein
MTIPIAVTDAIDAYAATEYARGKADQSITDAGALATAQTQITNLTNDLHDETARADALALQKDAIAAEYAQYKATHTVADPPPPAPTLGFGTYMGHFAAATVKTTIGKLPKFSTYYYQVSGSVPASLDIAKHKAEIDQGITQVIDLDYKSSTVSIASVATGAADTVLSAWLKDLATLADYAKTKNAEVWFSFVHEAIVHINQNKFANAPKPTTAQMAAAWNRVMGLCRTSAPNAVRTYWFGGMETKVGGVAGGVAHGDQLDPALIQAVTFDPYRFASHSDTETPQQTFGAVVDALKARSWAQGKPWGLTEYGTEASHGDKNNADWLTATVKYLRDQGAAIAVLFNRTNGSNNYVITDGSAPLSLAAYKTAVTST